MTVFHILQILLIYLLLLLDIHIHNYIGLLLPSDVDISIAPSWQLTCVVAIERFGRERKDAEVTSTFHLTAYMKRQGTRRRRGT